MSKYGITLKSPNLENITYSTRYTNKEIEDELIYYKAELCEAIIDDIDASKKRGVKFTINYIFSLLEVKMLLQYKSCIEDDSLYIDEVCKGTNEYNIDDSIELWEKSVNSDKEELLIYAFANVDKTIDCESKEHLVNCVRCHIDNEIEEMQESVQILVAYRIVKENLDKIVKDETNTSDI